MTPFRIDHASLIRSMNQETLDGIPAAVQAAASAGDHERVAALLELEAQLRLKMGLEERLPS